jgi:hypothetical protein
MFDPPNSSPGRDEALRATPRAQVRPDREEHHDDDGPGWAVVAVPLLGLMVLGVIALVFFLRLIS